MSATPFSSVFDHKNPFTLGVEEEYMLCDPVTGNLVNRAEQIMETLTEAEKPRFSYELIHSEIEINTPICTTVAEAMECVCHLRNRVGELGQQLGFRMGISGTHPTALADDQSFVDSAGYQWVASQLHYYALRNITFALHVHVALPDGDTAIAVTNAARRWLPVLLSLSANSPFFQAHNTGMFSARTFQFGAFPRTNIPGTFRDFTHFSNLVDTFTKMGSINQPRQIWWKIRPHGVYGTVEFRVCDVQRSLARTEMLVALSQAIVHRAAYEYRVGGLFQDLEAEYLNDGLWKATRFGFDARVADPADGAVATMAEMVEKLLEYVRPSLLELGTTNVIDTVAEVVQSGSEATEQLQVFEQSGYKGLQKMLMERVEFGEELAKSS